MISPRFLVTLTTLPLISLNPQSLSSSLASSVCLSPPSEIDCPNQPSEVPTSNPQVALSLPAMHSRSTMGPSLPLPTWPNPAMVLPLWKVTQVEGSVRAHVLFSLSKLSQIEKCRHLYLHWRVLIYYSFLQPHLPWCLFDSHQQPAPQGAQASLEPG